MPRRGNKTVVSVWVCDACKKQTGTTYLNTATHGKKLERKRFCQHERTHTEQFTRPEKSGSLGLARNK